ncbi:MAG: SAM-dependent methyltransferase [Bacteroidetes bacterium]|nr:SAM-dependent methyltransferase [Bacteroidota bacterium]
MSNVRSYKDPSGHVRLEEGRVIREVSLSYQENYDHLMSSGLYDELTKKGMLVNHKEVDNTIEGIYKTLQPQLIPFISYPWEWCFSQFQDAGLLTLEIQKIAMQSRMSLKDANALNVQFVSGSPVFIDTLSFEKYEKGQPWKAYHQFCEQFIAPLSLMHYIDADLRQLWDNNPDGMDIIRTSEMLPGKSRFRLGVNLHIHLQARILRSILKGGKIPEDEKLSISSVEKIIENLAETIKKFKPKFNNSEWWEYYADVDTDYIDQKAKILKKFLANKKFETIWDIGANDGSLSRIAVGNCVNLIALDNDHKAVQENYIKAREGKENVLPLVVDISNPTPAIGWENREFSSLMARGPADMLMALALVHHLVIKNNLHLDMIAETFSKMAGSIIVEFVPKDDPQFVELIKHREDIFEDYNQSTFETEFGKHFEITEKQLIEPSGRLLYQMRSKSHVFV